MGIFREHTSRSLKMLPFDATAPTRAASLEILATAANTDNDVLVGHGCALLNGHHDLDIRMWHVIHLAGVPGRSNSLFAGRRHRVVIKRTRWKLTKIRRRTRDMWGLIVDFEVDGTLHRVVVR